MLRRFVLPPILGTVSCFRVPMSVADGELLNLLLSGGKDPVPGSTRRLRAVGLRSRPRDGHTSKCDLRRNYV